jgi:hypothetical protein
MCPKKRELEVAIDHVSRRVAVVSALVDGATARLVCMDIAQLAVRKRELYTRLLGENHRLKTKLGRARTRPAVRRLTVAVLEDLALANASLKNELIQRFAP